MPFSDNLKTKEALMIVNYLFPSPESFVTPFNYLFLKYSRMELDIRGVCDRVNFLCQSYFFYQRFSLSYICDIWGFNKDENGMIPVGEVRKSGSINR